MTLLQFTAECASEGLSEICQYLMKLCAPDLSWTSGAFGIGDDGGRGRSAASMQRPESDHRRSKSQRKSGLSRSQAKTSSWRHSM